MLLFFLSCTLPPIAFNHYIPTSGLLPTSAELGFAVSGFWANMDGSDGTLFLNIPVWYRKSISDYLELGARGYFSLPPWIFLGPELSVGRNAIRLIVGAYPVHILISDELHVVPLPYYQWSLIFGGARFYTGLKGSPLAFGGLVGTNITLNQKWDVRIEGSYLIPPPWIDDQSIRGRAINLGVAFANRR